MRWKRMDMLTDPDMKEIVDEFCDESSGLLAGLESLLEEMEDDGPDSKKLENFGQMIDRIMGAAKSLGANEVGTFCELGKIIGYKSSQVSDNAPLLEVVVAILFDAVDILNLMIENIKKGEGQSLNSINTEKFIERMKWLSDKFKDIERSSVVIKDSGNSKLKDKLDNDDIDKLLNRLNM